MLGRAIAVLTALCLALGCTTPPRPDATGADLRLGSRWLRDSVEYRRFCFVPADSAVDVRRPCVLRDQGLR
jgi:hypothetical protein